MRLSLVGAVGALVGALACGCTSSGDGPVGPDRSSPGESGALLTGDQLQRALLTDRTVGAAYERQDAARGSAPASLGCLDALDPSLLGAGVEGEHQQARVEFDTSAALPSLSVTSVVVTFDTDRAGAAALDAFSTVAGDCTEVQETDGASTAELSVTSRLVPPKAPVQREVLVEGRGSIGNGVTAPAVGVSVKVGRIGRHLVAVETTGVGAYAPDITPYYNVARARLVDVLAGTDPGPGRPVRP